MAERMNGADTRREFTEFLIGAGALKFGSFTLKSGRQSPYFINAGAFNDGSLIARLGEFYAARIVAAQDEGILPARIDTVFGPAYKGIPLAVATSMALWRNHNQTVGYTFDRKERKDHGDGGMFVGTQPADGMTVVMVDDVMTAGTAVRETVPKLKDAADVNVAGLILSVDRKERTKDSDVSAVDAVSREFGFPVLPIVTVYDIFEAAQALTGPDGAPLLDDDVKAAARAYLKAYGA